jgi:2-aminoadipate transaminase
MPDSPSPRFSIRSQRAREQAISFLMQQAVENRDVISLAAGLVDEASLPVAECRQTLQGLFSDEARGRMALQYGTTAGADGLREQLRIHLARQEHCSVSELGVDAGQFVLTTGSQQLLALVADALFDPEDICLVAAPTYFVFLGVLNGVGARTIAIDTDEHGMKPDALERELARLESVGDLPKVKLIYLVSYYENPSGVSLATERRHEIVQIAKRWSRDHRLFVLEDAAYRELRYDGPDRPSMWGSDTSRDTVILAQTFSKSFSPGVRVGYGVLPKELVGPVCDLKGNDDFGSANLNQHLLAAVLASGRYTAHVDQVRTAYRVKRDAMLQSLNQEFAGIPGASWLKPEGGLYVWLSLPDSIETGFSSRMFQLSAKTHRVMYVPGELCYPPGSTYQHRNQMRLSFGVQNPAGIAEGIRRLAAAVRDRIREG